MASLTRDAVQVLLTSDLLRGVSEVELRALAPQPSWITLCAGETLISQGEPGEAFYFLVHGRLRVFADDGSRRRKIGEVLPGEGVGEMSLMTGELTSATVRVMHDSSLIRFSRDSYLQLMECCPQAALQVMRTVIKRLRQGIAPRGAPSFKTIAVVPLDPAIDAARFTTTLVAQITHLQPAVRVALEHLEPDQTDLLRQPERLSPEQDHAISASLIERERSRPDIVIYQAEAAPVEWSQIAIRQADLVLLLASTEADPQIRPVEQVLVGSVEADLAPRTDLVLVHPEQWHTACGARHWLAPRAITELHHIRRWQGDDFARLARALTGNEVCVVLGGGGARAFAEIGVLRALQEAGIPIDRVGGTSMGSLIGAQFALGHNVEQIKATNREIWLERKPLSDYTFPAMSILRGRRLHNLTHATFADHRIEDLRIPFFAVSCDLTDGSQVVHDRGPIWQAVRASASLPGTGPPLFLGDKILVDGGVVNNMPVDVMRQRSGGFVIAVSVDYEKPMAVGTDVEQTPSGWWILWRRLNPFVSSLKVPSIFEILYRTATLNSSRRSNAILDEADLAITPPVANVSIFDFKRLDHIIDAGYRETVEVLRTTRDPRLTRYLPDRIAAPKAEPARPRPSRLSRLAATSQ